jgi:hypothetical protein
MDTNFSYYKKNGNLLYDIPVFISEPEILTSTSILNTDDKFNKYNNINIDEAFIRDLSMYGYEIHNEKNEFFDNPININSQIIIISIISFILFIYILFSFFC